AAVADAWRHEETREIVDALAAAVRGEHALVVVDRSAREDQGIGVAVPDDHPAAVLAEGVELRIVGADDLVELLLRPSEVGLEVRLAHAAPVELRVLVNPRLEMSGRDWERVVAGKAAERRAALESEPETLAGGGGRTIPDLADGGR